jgi:hypothetical protein
MNRITIIQADNHVGIDGDFREVDLSSLDPQIHAIQFSLLKGFGEIEWDENTDGTRPPNQRITDLSPYQWAIDLWLAAVPTPEEPEEESPEDPPTPPTFEQLKAAKLVSINAQRDYLETEGFTFSGKTFDSDQRSTDRIQMAALAAQAAIITGQPFNIVWTAKDNTTIALDAPAMLGLAVAFAQHGAYLHEVAKALKAQAASATTQAQLDAIVWPA